MSDQRFKYYTGYEVDNEPSDDEEENPSIIQNSVASESSDDEFDKPIRDYIEKTMSQSAKTKTNNSTVTNANAFADEMEDELDQIYNNFISRGTFQLPLSTQKSPTEEKKPVQEESDDESDDSSPVENVDEQEKINDDLLYDPKEEEEDEKWMNNERLKSQGVAAGPSALGPTDAVLNCPGCMVLISHDCQRHETNKNQYRAMFVFNCTIDENRLASVKNIDEQKSSKKKRNKRLKTDSNDTDNEEILRPVLCSECGTEIGVYEAKDELYHFSNVLTSH